MRPQVITEVLQDCGSDIDAAIRRLGELQLSADGAVAARRPPVSPGGASPGRVTPSPGSAKRPASPVQHGVRSTLHTVTRHQCQPPPSLSYAACGVHELGTKCFPASASRT